MASVSPNSPISVDVEIGARTRRLKLQIRDLTEHSLKDKISSSLGCSTAEIVKLQRYSYTVAAYVAVETPSQYGALYRSAKGNRYAHLRAAPNDRKNSQEGTSSNPLSLRRTEIPLVIGSTDVCGRHDTGAEGNFMVEALASRLDLKVSREDVHREHFSIGNGKVIQSTGIIKTWCTFAKTPDTKVACVFHVFSQLAVSLIMGFPFLEATRTLSTFRHRLQQRPACANRLPMVSLINSNNRAKRRLSCYIDGRETYVNADSGSDLDAMSTSYAQSHGYSLNTDLACKRYIQLADTSIVTSVGQVAAAVTIGQGHSQMTFAKVFDILPDLQSDVLLGEDSLDEMRAFTLYETSFVDRLVGAQHLELGVLINLGPVAQKISKILAGNAKVSSQQSQPSKAKEQDNRDMEEIVRQDRAFTPKQLFDNELHEEMVGATDPTMPKAPITGSKAAVLDEQKRRFEERRRRMDQGEASFRRKIRESSTMMRGGISIAEEQGNSTAA